ncbi:RING finger protein 141-like [Pundamilia nyererei]|uniref:RING finger protein 141-like n=1 Tax=Pundamilia nyererei TaxID=303518 RepID=A0A9Y6M4A6_9CICH|nr:PREDICTED: RING finger protein 141-like [Pundamilia nyererei]
MGQQISGQAVMNHLPEKLVKHAGLVRDSGYLNYEEFLARVAELNDVTAKLAAGQQKHLLFEVQPGSDATALWKVAVRVVCTKINKENGMVEASRIMNLYQFIQLYRDITSQAAEVLSVEGATKGPSTELPSTDSCQASMWMGRRSQVMEGCGDVVLLASSGDCFQLAPERFAAECEAVGMRIGTFKSEKGGVD